MSRLHRQPLEHAAIIQSPVAKQITTGIDPPAATAPTESPGLFLRVPREIRDNIYRYLLSTKHTRHQCFDPDGDIVSHTYRFHTPILLTNRQIFHEASDVFYMENLFVRVNSVTHERIPHLDPWTLHRDYELPSFSDDSKVQACMRHVMEIDLILYHSPSLPCKNYHFILASDDLPLLCKALLLVDGGWFVPRQIQLLQEMELRIIISDDVGTTSEGLEGLNSSADRKTAVALNAATKHATTSGEGPTRNPIFDVKRNTIIDEVANTMANAQVAEAAENNFSLSKKSLSTNSQLRRLLEPFRVLHSVKKPYIDAPISERSRQEIENILSRASPTFLDLFPAVFSAYEDANRTFEAGDFDSAISKILLHSQLVSMIQLRDNALTIMKTGPFAGYPYWEIFDMMKYTLWKNLARATLKYSKDLPHVRMAQEWSQRIIKVFIRGGRRQESRHEKAMAYYLEAEVWEALDQLGEHHGRLRSESLQDVISMLTNALQHEPENTMLQQELKRRQEEKQQAESMEEVKEMEKGEGRVHSRERTAI